MFGASPFVALVKRELVTTLRQGNLFLLLVLTLLVQALVLTSSAAIGMGGPMALAMLATVFYLAGLLVLPPLAGISFSSEMQRDTWTLLQMTLISRWQLVVGKFINVVGVYFLMIVGTMPILGITFYFAGIDRFQFQYLVGVLLSATLMNAALALWCSTFARRTIPGITLAFAVVLLANSAFFLLILMIDGGVIMRSVGFLVPLLNILSTTGGLGPFSSSSWSGPIVSMTIALVALALSATRVGKLQEHVPAQTYTWFSGKRRGRHPAPAAAHREPAKQHPDGANPIFWRLRIARATPGVGIDVRASSAVAVLLLLLSWFSLDLGASSRIDELMAFYLAPVVWLIVISPLFIVGVLVEEREANTWEQLCMSLIAPGMLLRGALSYAAFRLGIVALTMAAGCVVVIAATLFEAPLLLIAVVILATSSLYLTLTVCAWIAVVRPNAGHALILSYLVCGILLAALPFTIASILEQLEMWRLLSSQVVQEFLLPLTLTLIPSPPLAYIFVLEGGSQWVFWGNCALSVLVGTACLWGATHSLARRQMREA